MALDDEQQNAINSIRKDISEVEKRLTAAELKSRFYKECMDELKADFRMLQGNIKIDIERVQVSLHKDIKTIQDTLNLVLRQQAVDEAKMDTGINAGKLVIDKLPWLAAISAGLLALVQFFKDKAG